MPEEDLTPVESGFVRPWRGAVTALGSFLSFLVALGVLSLVGGGLPFASAVEVAAAPAAQEEREGEPVSCYIVSSDSEAAVLRALGRSALSAVDQPAAGREAIVVISAWRQSDLVLLCRSVAGHQLGRQVRGRDLIVVDLRTAFPD